MSKSASLKQSPAKSGSRTFAFGGGVIGLITFLAVGLLPSIVYGGFAGVTLASAILGGPVGASLVARGLVVFGMTVGLLGTAAMFVVIGAALGAAVFQAARVVAREPEAEAETANSEANGN